MVVLLRAYVGRDPKLLAFNSEDSARNFFDFVNEYWRMLKRGHLKAFTVDQSFRPSSADELPPGAGITSDDGIMFMDMAAKMNQLANRGNNRRTVSIIVHGGKTRGAPSFAYIWRK